MAIKINGILAVGCNKSYLFIDINGENHTCYITRKTYYKLKEEGIQTGQARRYKK